MSLTLEYLGTFWGKSGDLFYMDHPDGRRATVAVDSIGHTYADVRRVPEGGPKAGFYFHTERTGHISKTNAVEAERQLREQGFTTKRTASNAHRVEERPESYS